MSDDFFKTVAFTSNSNEVKQSLSNLPEAELIRASLQSKNDSEISQEETSDVELPQSVSDQAGDEVNETKLGQTSTISSHPHAALNRESDEVSLKASSDQVPSTDQAANTDHHNDGQTEETAAESAQPQKLYDRFNRTVEQSSLELFQDPTSTGVAWMIRDQDDAIEHRDRLLVDNKAYYKRDKIEYLPYLIVILGLSIGAWLFWNSQSADPKANDSEVKASESVIVK